MKTPCIDAINEATEYMRAKSDLGYIGQAGFVDVRRVFDTLDHEILVTELDYYGSREPIKKLLASFLNDGRQYISGNATNSLKQKVTTGVPQGLVSRTFFSVL